MRRYPLIVANLRILMSHAVDLYHTDASYRAHILAEAMAVNRAEERRERVVPRIGII